VAESRDSPTRRRRRDDDHDYEDERESASRTSREAPDAGRRSDMAPPSYKRILGNLIHLCCWMVIGTFVGGLTGWLLEDFQIESARAQNVAIDAGFGVGASKNPQVRRDLGLDRKQDTSSLDFFRSPRGGALGGLLVGFLAGLLTSA